ncbi:hypothetical protein ABZS72_16190 [Streptomyces albidoflavus]|uniref:hypothetical protein n=1 Tax=Streptomyces albidoflavus TaxID=1886 RepID=UPI0033A03CD6
MISPPRPPRLFSRLGLAFGVEFPSYTACACIPTDRAEGEIGALWRFETEREGTFLLAVTTQAGKDPARRSAWARRLVSLYLRHRAPPVLLVVCPDRETAEWASQPITAGGPFSSLVLTPVAAGPHNLPPVTDPREAAQDPAFATLSALAHARTTSADAILEALSAALRDVPEDVADPLTELTAQGLGKLPAADLWRNLMAVDLSFYKSPISQEIRAEGEARALLLVLRGRGFDVPSETEQTISACRDRAALERWLSRAGTAANLDEVFADH